MALMERWKDFLHVLSVQPTRRSITSCRAPISREDLPLHDTDVAVMHSFLFATLPSYWIDQRTVVGIRYCPRAQCCQNDVIGDDYSDWTRQRRHDDQRIIARNHYIRYWLLSAVATDNATVWRTAYRLTSSNIIVGARACQFARRRISFLFSPSHLARFVHLFTYLLTYLQY